ncbi:DUF3976 domain-containing protein [Bacillus sp. DX4.1]|uniref:DUF3976 domain-containing protein n=1 Tax=Bacillus sp. DX4.1 TaxID=3055867 RepID=UPI0025A1393A|nr:DUF3976 domain-containing protein [Bacillus sp. DX4.1]MDM5187548.1 DUF3976 domain-containing protein [Bacillus sp. DX4.1]
MQFLYSFGIGLILFVAMYLFIRKDITKDNTLTKRGFYKLIGCLVVMLIGIVVLVVVISKRF